MQDQNITVQNNTELTKLGGITAPATNPTAAITTGSTGLGIGAYSYSVSFTSAGYDGAGYGESMVSSGVNVTTTSGNQHVSLTSIPLGPTGTTGRNIYRTKVGVSTQFFLHTIADNTTTTYADSATDASISGGHQNSSTFGGTLKCQSVVLSGATPCFRSPTGFFGFLGTGADNQLVCIGNTGNMVIKGNQYGTVGGSVTLATGQAMNGFDIGEVYYCDQPYEQGTVVCPGPNGKMQQCTHDNCFAASVISHTPGLALGVENEDPTYATQLDGYGG